MLDGRHCCAQKALERTLSRLHIDIAYKMVSRIAEYCYVAKVYLIAFDDSHLASNTCNIRDCEKSWCFMVSHVVAVTVTTSVHPYLVTRYRRGRVS